MFTSYARFLNWLTASLQMAATNKDRFSKASHNSEYVSRRRRGLAESLDSKPSLHTGWPRARSHHETKNKNTNPYAMPKDMDIFKQLEDDFILKQQEKRFYSSLPTEAKGTYVSRLRCRSAPLRFCGEGTIKETQKSNTNITTLSNVINKGHGTQRETMIEQLAKKRERFNVQYSLTVKRETIKNLERGTLLHHQKNDLATKYLEEDAIAFEKFIKENDQKSVEAVKMAEKETMHKVEKIVEIKKLTAQMMTMKSDIAKYQEILKEYQTFKDFLTAVAPAEWREEQNLKKQKKIADKMREKLNKDEKKMMPLTLSGRRDSRVSKTNPLSKSGKPGTVHGTQSRLEVNETEISDSDEEPELYFSDPRQMLNVLTILEEKNLSYIQNFQETEEAMDEIQKMIQQSHSRMKNLTEVLQQQIDIIKNTIQREQEKTAELMLKSKMFFFGEFKADKQGEMLNILHKKVKEVYSTYAGDVAGNISTLNMLTNIEHRLEEVMDNLEIMPPEKVEAVRKTKEKEKRQMMREEKVQQNKLHQEERLKLALERATCESKRRNGRKLMPRSRPSELKKRGQMHAMTTKEWEDAVYFFSAS